MKNFTKYVIIAMCLILIWASPVEMIMKYPMRYIQIVLIVCAAIAVFTADVIGSNRASSELKSEISSKDEEIKRLNATVNYYKAVCSNNDSDDLEEKLNAHYDE